MDPPLSLSLAVSEIWGRLLEKDSTADQRMMAALEGAEEAETFELLLRMLADAVAINPTSNSGKEAAARVLQKFIRENVEVLSRSELVEAVEQISLWAGTANSWVEELMVLCLFHAASQGTLRERCLAFRQINSCIPMENRLNWNVISALNRSPSKSLLDPRVIALFEVREISQNPPLFKEVIDQNSLSDASINSLKMARTEGEKRAVLISLEAGIEQRECFKVLRLIDAIIVKDEFHELQSPELFEAALEALPRIAQWSSIPADMRCQAVKLLATVHPDQEQLFSVLRKCLAKLLDVTPIPVELLSDLLGYLDARSSRIQMTSFFFCDLAKVIEKPGNRSLEMRKSLFLLYCNHSPSSKVALSGVCHLFNMCKSDRERELFQEVGFKRAWEQPASDIVLKNFMIIKLANALDLKTDAGRIRYVRGVAHFFDDLSGDENKKLSPSRFKKLLRLLNEGSEKMRSQGGGMEERLLREVVERSCEGIECGKEGEDCVVRKSNLDFEISRSALSSINFS